MSETPDFQTPRFPIELKNNMRAACTINVTPLENTEWWNKHAKYSKFRRQGLDIICATCEHPKPRANLVFLTGLTESFIKYAEFIQFFYEKGFSVYTYDHQSQGLSGRCKLDFLLSCPWVIFNYVFLQG